jgi:hypothetical protein
MPTCICGWECDYVGTINVEGCTNPKCQHYVEPSERIQLPSGNWFDLVPPPQTDRDRPEDDFSDLFDDDNDDAKTPLAWPPPVWHPAQDKD